MVHQYGFTESSDESSEQSTQSSAQSSAGSHGPLRRRAVSRRGVLGGGLSAAFATASGGFPLGASPAAAATATGTTTRTAAGCPAPDPGVPKRQFRAVWIASVANIDWPSRPGLSVTEQQAEYRALLDDAERNRFNAVVVQIRPTADAFWPSPYEPWSSWLTGTQGRDPGYDPLEFAVREAHARNLEFHGWFNPYRVSMGTDPSVLTPDHPARVHPDWIVSYGGKLYYNPGIPEVRRFCEDAIMDAVRRYDLDGVHFDDYFYPYPVGTTPFGDDATYEQYGDGFADKASWRRNNIDLLIQELGSRIKDAKPWVKFGVSPFAVWRNQATDPEGSATTAGVQTYDDLAADTRKWVREEWIDYIVPQVYWSIGFAPADYAVLVPWWSEQVAGTDVQLFIGQATYKVGTSTQSPEWSDPDEMSRHLTFNREYPQVLGDVYFSAKDVRANRLDHMDIVRAEHYSRPALVPVAEQLGGHAPARPLLAAAEPVADGIRLTWVARPPDEPAPTSYAVYRFDGRGPVDACDLADAHGLVATVRDTGTGRQTFLDSTASKGQTYTYVVTALDRIQHESEPSRSRTVRR
ncbi:family 10 glycosylhydrolase [Actinopolymorpha sp. NPDC004070]|uniref:glycoside hydrolase family 10 protein n=1 Tax=Actinopolymorpha sp. NPDC004070 TaxID=3154548 RepID=UPI0033B5DB10